MRHTWITNSAFSKLTGIKKVCLSCGQSNAKLTAEAATLRAERDEARAILDTAIAKLETIVVPDGVDAGVIWLSQESPTHYDAEVRGQVYDHEHFSPLGDALVELYGILAARREGGA